MQSIALFDFDGTLTTKDSFLEMIKFQKGTFRFYTGFLVNAPWLIAYKMKWISNQKAKERILHYFFAGTPADVFQQQCEKFATVALPSIIRKKGIKEIELHLMKGNKVVIVSASAAIWFQKYFDNKPIQFLCTELEVKEHKITGKILGKNCYGEEKTKRILHSFPELLNHTSYAYGDTKGDKPMLALATFPFYKPFR